MTPDITDDKPSNTEESSVKAEIPKDIPVVGIVALEKGFISKEQLSSVLNYCKAEQVAGKNIRLEDVLLEKKIVSADTLESLIVKSIRRMNKEFCDIIVEKEFVSRQHADNALSLQAKKYKEGELVLVSDFLIKAGVLSTDQRDLVYGIQSERVTEMFKQYSENKNGNGQSKARKSEQTDLDIGYKIPATAKVAVRNKLINREQLEETLQFFEEEKKAGRKMSFEDALVEKKFVTADVVKKLIAETIRKMKMSLGEIAVEEGYVTQKQLDTALKIQAEKSKNGETVLIGDLMIVAGLLSEKKRDEILEAQNMKTLDWMKVDFDPADDEEFKNSERYQNDILTGELAVTYSFVTGKEYEIGLKYLEKAYKQNLKISLERILLEKGFLDEEKATRLGEMIKFLRTRDFDMEFATLAVSEEYLSRGISKAMLSRQVEEFDQKKQCMTLAEIVLDEKLMTLQQCNEILEKQNRELISEDMAKGGDSETEEDVSEKETGILPEIEMGSEILLNIGEDLLDATVIIPIGYPNPVSLEDIKTLIKEKDVSFGIVDDAEIEEQINQDETEVRLVVAARGKPATVGTDAELKINFEREYLNPGKVTGSGHIDFKDRGDVPFAEKGSVLVEIIPEKQGIQGMDVYGNPIAALPVKGISVTAGKGTVFSEDRLRIIATEDGNPSMTVAGEVSVRQEIEIKGDVDYNTGNIVFDGHIVVKGMVKEGFSVIGGSLSVKEIDGGLINLKGNLEVSGGILNSLVKLEGNLQAMYMKDSVVESYSDVIIKKEIIGSTILTSGACKSDRTTVITSEISAMNGIEASLIGTDVSEKCILKVGVTEHTDKEVKAIKEILDQKTEILHEKQQPITDSESQQSEYHKKISELAQGKEENEKSLGKLKEKLAESAEEDIKTELTEAISGLEMKTKAFDQEITKYFTLQDNLMDEVLGLREECETIIEEIEELNTAIRQIRDWEKQQSKSAEVKIMKGIQEGTFIVGPNTSMVVKKEIKNSCIKEVPGDLLLKESKWVMKVFPN